MSAETPYKGINWCEHNMNAKFCIVCKDKVDKKPEPKAKKPKAVKPVPAAT
ncbi:MAG: hypothetical protein HY291_09460 [Planctomycetes bacterium]|nr:hypothetical protein [Planctomycetota bacterium]